MMKCKSNEPFQLEVIQHIQNTLEEKDILINDLKKSYEEIKKKYYDHISTPHTYNGLKTGFFKSPVSVSMNLIL